MIPTRMNPMGWQPYRCKLNWLESTGTQYIDTGYKPIENSRIEAYASCGSQVVSVCGTRTDSGHVGYVMNGTNRTDAWIIFNQAAGQNTYNGSVYADQTMKTHIVLAKDGCYVNDRLIYTPPATQGLACTLSLYLFAQHNWDGPYNRAALRVYSFRISEGNTCVRDMIPVLDKSGVPCMYDRCTRSFYYNAGTGTFNYA